MDYDKPKYEKTKVAKSKRKIVIAVLGSSSAICTTKAYNHAFEAGEEIAKAGAVALTGGGLGVMEAALKGAKKNKGETIAIVPWETMEKVNDYADTVIATGIGWSRNSINLNSCDGAIIVGGGAGTLNEATYGYMMSKPIVSLTPSGGMAEEITDRYFDVRKTEYIWGAQSAKEAVKLIMKLIKNKRKSPIKQTELDKDLLKREEKQDWNLLKQKKEKGMIRKI